MMCVFVLAVHGEKRLLLSDPDVVNNRLLQMEKEIQSLTAELESNKHIIHYQLSVKTNIMILLLTVDPLYMKIMI
jgi:hypothetical protein